MALRPDEGGHHEAQRPAHQWLSQIETQRQHQRDAKERGGSRGVRERGSELPERAGALGEGVDLPHQTDDTEGGGDGGDADQRQRDAARPLSSSSLTTSAAARKPSMEAPSGKKAAGRCTAAERTSHQRANPPTVAVSNTDSRSRTRARASTERMPDTMATPKASDG